MGSKIVTASVTPNGYADAALPLSDEPLKDAYQFVMPHEESMSVNEFLNILEASPKTGILQNLLVDKYRKKCRSNYNRYHTLYQTLVLFIRSELLRLRYS